MHRHSLKRGTSHNPKGSESLTAQPLGTRTRALHVVVSQPCHHQRFPQRNTTCQPASIVRPSRRSSSIASHLQTCPTLPTASAMLTPSTLMTTPTRRTRTRRRTAVLPVRCQRAAHFSIDLRARDPLRLLRHSKHELILLLRHCFQTATVKGLAVSSYEALSGRPRRLCAQTTKCTSQGGILFANHVAGQF